LLRSNIRWWASAWAASAFIAVAMLPAAEPVDASTPSLLEQIGDNEIPNTIMDGIYEIGSDVLAFLMRMSPI